MFFHMDAKMIGNKESPDQHAAAVQPDRLVSIKEVQGLIGMGPSSIYAWAKGGKFPEPIRLSARCTRWRLSQVQAWIAEQGKPQ